MTSPTEPGGWELKRGLDQLRSDMRDDFNGLKGDVGGIAGRLDSMDARYVTHREHTGLVTRVNKLEDGAEKRSDRSITIWLAIGIAVLSSLTSIVIAVFQLLGK